MLSSCEVEDQSDKMKRTRRVVAAAPASDDSDDEMPEEMTASQGKEVLMEARKAEEEGRQA